MVAHGPAESLQKHMPCEIAITEIPLADRELELPLRFRVTLATGGMTVWTIAYHQSSFELT